MDIELVAASAAITLALVFYTVGVFFERKSGSLRRSHLACFWCGLVFDTTGTALMTNMAAGGQAAGFGIHGISGMLAIALMLVHATWATWVYVRGSGRARTAFHRFSTVVWLVWLVTSSACWWASRCSTCKASVRWGRAWSWSRPSPPGLPSRRGGRVRAARDVREAAKRRA